MKKFLLISILIPQFLFAQNISDKNVTIKVLTFNILHGATTQGNFDLDVIAKVIIDSDPDLVALQEVDFQTNRAKGYDLATELGWRTKMVSIFGRAMYYDGGEYGEAILSKTTIIQSRNVALPHSPGNEPRAALEITTVLASGDSISFVGTHLDHLRDENDRIEQVKAINRAFLNNSYPTLLAGDLNAVPGSKPIDILEQFWMGSYDPDNPAPTFPSSSPTKKIDYVYSYPHSHWEVLQTEVIEDAIASDHCAYLVTLKLLEE